MNLLDLVMRSPKPTPWAEGETIPWSDPGFSARMLQEHLSQVHDEGSRRFEIIDRQVAWVHEQVLGGRPARVLDLACGPGLYTSRLAKLGHTCVGIDFAPASIGYAAERAELEDLTCTGFDGVQFLPGIGEVDQEGEAELLAILAVRGEGEHFKGKRRSLAIEGDDLVDS